MLILCYMYCRYFSQSMTCPWILFFIMYTRILNLYIIKYVSLFPWFLWIYFLLILLQVLNPLGINFVLDEGWGPIFSMWLSSCSAPFITLFPLIWNASFITYWVPSLLFPKSTYLFLLWNHTVFITQAVSFLYHIFFIFRLFKHK